MIEATSAKALIEGKKGVISGKFSNFQRETLQAVCQWFGAKVSSSISKSTNYVIAGDAMGPAKWEKCKELNIPIVTEAEFVELMLNDTLVIPEGITEIDHEAFYNCRAIKHVVLPDTVTRIGSHAFWSCTNLEVVELPKSLTYIFYEAFDGCDNLKEVKVADGNPCFRSIDGVIYTKDSVFLCPPKLEIEVVEIPEGITNVQGFKFNEHIKEVKLPEGVKKIDDFAFSNCKNLAKINLPASIEYINQFSFYRCALSSITIPDQVKIIGWSVFGECSSLKSVILPDGLTEISLKAFCFCSSLEEISIPDSVTYIDSEAFCGCHSLKDKHIKLPMSLKEMCSTSFLGCDLESCEAPKEWAENIKRYGYHGFSNCEIKAY